MKKSPLKEMKGKCSPSYIYEKNQKFNKNINVQNFKISSTIKRLWPYVKDVKWWLLLMFCFNIFAISLEVCGMFFTGFVYDKYLMTIDIEWVKIFSTFCLYCVIILISYLFGHFFDYICMLSTLWISEKRICFKLRRDIFNKFQKMPVKYFDQSASGELITRTTNDVDNIAIAINQYVNNTIFWIMISIGIVITMLVINVVLALITLIVYPIMIYSIIKIAKFINLYYKKQQAQVGCLNSFVEERVSGTKIISLYQKEKINEAEFEAINKNLTKNSIVANSTSNIMMPLNNFFNNMAFVILSLLGISLTATGMISKEWGLVKYENVSSLLIVFTIFARNLTNPINQIASSFGPIMLALASASRIFEILDKPEEADGENAKDIKNVKGYVQAKKLCFGYDSSKIVLSDINFNAKPGQVTALVGPTGAGKTTIISLITKFYKITSGDLLIDGVSINDITAKSLRQNITMVLQDTFLFKNTIRENIRYGRIDATDLEVKKAAELSNASHFIEQLPFGYDTIIEDNGANLSQGQRQLLAIARAFLANSKIIILDEATSNIDTKTELDIQKALEKLMKDRTTFIIAHRLSTIKNADNILVLDQGKIIESGKHDDLLKKEGFYAKLYNSQFEGKTI